MVVQHNMQAANAQRMLNVTTGQQAKSTEKLSSGYKINRAADDAAGLSISEKMRKQIRGLDRASTNAEDGVSTVQTAEGALTEVHDMLQRMNELAVQAANGTNSESDRDSIQNEISQLETEINRVSETTKFNETYLLKGSNGLKTVYLKGHDAGLQGVFVDGVTTASVTMTLKVGNSVSIGGKTYNLTSGAKGKDDVRVLQAMISNAASNEISKVTINGTAYEWKDDTDGTKRFISGTGTSYSAAQLSAKITDGTKVQTMSSGSGKLTTRIARDSTLQANITIGKAVSLARRALTQANNIGVGDTSVPSTSAGYGSAATVKAQKKDSNGKFTEITSVKDDVATTNYDSITLKFAVEKGNVKVQKDLDVALHVGADADMTNKIGIKLETMNSANLGIRGINVKDDSGIAATYAIDAIQDAITKVSAQRSALGAVQNRLEHTISNLDNVVENTNSAESRIRDTDMADEMVTHAKNNILAQAGQSMLAQANQSNQGVLSLLG